MITLTRYGSTPNGTFGQIQLENQMIFTVERPWENNKPFVSCIPAGTYTLESHDSQKYGKTYALVNESLGVRHWKPTQRSLILFHSANYSDQLQGCIAPGDKFGVVHNKWAVMNSRDSLKVLLNELYTGDQFKIEWVNNG